MGYGMVTAHNLGQIGLKQEGTTEAYDLYAARSDDEDDARDGLKCGQLPMDLIRAS